MVLFLAHHSLKFSPNFVDNKLHIVQHQILGGKGLSATIFSQGLSERILDLEFLTELDLFDFF